MKTTIKIALLILAAMMAIAASNLGNSPVEEKATHIPCYTDQEVLLLMKTNGWSETEAIRILELSCAYPVKP